MVEKTPAALAVPLLATKGFIPAARADLVRRPHLVARLQASVGKSLILVSAPAGFGKTTLLAEWYGGIRSQPGGSPPRLGWVALDERDNDPVRFWRYVGTAFEAALPGSGRSMLALLEPPQSSDSFELPLTMLINALAETPEEIFLALDDYHAISEPSIHQAVAFLLEHLPPTVHLIITGRVPPPLPLSRLRARGQLSEIRADDLRFTSEESIQLLHRLLGDALPEGELSSLEKQIEGWAAGLQLAALCLRGAEPGRKHISSVAWWNPMVLEYVTEEILHRQPATVQRFLLHTSILDEFSAALCDAVTGDQDGHGMLETLERENLFVIPLDHERRWYRYHHLFADMLRQRLARTLPEAIPRLHRRAAQWLEQQGQLAGAIEHTLAGEDYDHASRLIESYFASMEERSEWHTLRRWLDRLPRAMMQANPSLALIYAWALIATGRFTAAETYASEAEVAMAALSATLPEGQAKTWRGHTAAIRATAAINGGDKQRAKALSLEALTLLSPSEALPRTVAALSLADAYQGLNDLPAATHAYTEAYQTSSVTHMYPITLNALSNLGHLYERRGQLRQAALTYERAQKIAEAQSGFFYFASKSHVGLARVLREWNDLAAARTATLRGMDCARKWGHLEHLVDGYLCLADIQWAQGESDASLSTLREAEPLIQLPDAHPEVVARFTSYQASRWIFLGQLNDAARWAEEFDASMEAESRLHRPGIVTLARLRLAEGAPERALALLKPLLALVEQVGLYGDKISICILLALAEHAAHQPAKSVAALRQALELGEPERYRRIFLDEGAPLGSLLEAFPRSGPAGVYARRLLADIRRERRLAERSAALVLTDPLTDREQEVLRLIAEGASNQEIAETLVIALGTVKKHISSIFGKVGVASRTQLLVQARELKLL